MTRFGPLASGGHTKPRDRSYWVIDGKLAGGAYPYSGSSAAGVAMLENAVRIGGVSVFLDLTEAGSTAVSDGHLAPYGDHLERLGAEMVRYPYRDMDIPTERMMTDILDTIDEKVDAGEVVYVHCWGGLGRTGTVVACWLLRHGAADHETVFDVLSDLRRQDVAARRASPQTQQQRQFVLDWPVGR